MNEYSDDFKGVRFPRNLWLDKTISFIEKSILVVVKNLDKGDDHCWATNNYLADFLQCSVPTITRAIAHLKELGYIEELGEGKTGVCRKLKVIIDITDYPNQNDYTPNQNDYTPNQNDEGTLIKMIRGSNQNDEGVSSKGLPNNIYNSIYNNINNNIGETENFSSAETVSPTDGCDVITELDSETKKTKCKTKKQQRYDEVINNVEFNTLLHSDLEEKDFSEIDALWKDFVELRCSKDYKAFTDGAAERNLKILKGTNIEERKAILEKSIVKGWTGLFPLNDYDKKHLEQKSTNIEGSDAWIYKQIFDTKCKEKEDILPEGTTHNLLTELVQKYGEERVKKIYYEKVKPQIENIYGIKRDWVK